MSDKTRTTITTKFISQIENFGIKPSKIFRNLSVQELVDIAVSRNEGIVTSTKKLAEVL